MASNPLGRVPAAALAFALIPAACALAQDSGQGAQLVERIRKLRTVPQAPDSDQPACPPSAAPGVCVVRLPDGAYPKSVAFFYTSWPPPKNARRILYLHGHLQPFKTILAYFDFKKLLSASGSKDTVVIVPDGTGPGYTNETYISEWRAAADAPKRFRRFVAGVEKVLAGAPVETDAAPTLVLAGHSGAGSILDRILDCGSGNAICWPGVREVYLFDAAFSPADFKVYADFAAAPGHRFLSVYFSSTHNDEIWAQTAPGRDKKDFEKNAVRSDSLSPDALSEKMRASTTAFVHETDEKIVGHMGVVGKYFPMFLAPASGGGN